MKKTIIYLLPLFLILASLNSCKKKGCTDPEATNYNENAGKDDGSCIYEDTDPVTVDRISYGMDDRQHFDLYLPPGHDESTKTVVLIHGGAWAMGPLHADSVLLFGELGINLTSRLLNEGYAVAIMKYRLACYTSNPAELSGDTYFYMQNMLEDVELAIAKLKTDAGSLGISASNFALLGESAGAHIALMYALRSDDPDLKTVISFYAPTRMDEEEFKENGNSAVYSNFGVNSIFAIRDISEGCDMRTTGNMSIFWGLNSFVGHELELGTQYPEYTDTLSPAYANNITRNMPVFLMHGESDDLVPNGHADSLMNVLNTKFGTSPAPLADFSGQHKMIKYSNCGHGWSGGGCNKNLIRNDVIKWLEAHF